MSNTLFTVEFPLVETKAELEKLIQNHSNYDPYFIASGCCKERREKFDKLWAKYEPYADSHFLKQVKTNFHQRTWEMYVGNVLLIKNLTITSKDEGPDFIVGDNLYIECVASTKGALAKLDSVPEMFVAENPEKIRAQDVPADQMILRMTSVIKDKHEKYQNWNNIDKNKPFIIAVNSGSLEYPQDYLGIPLIIKALFGLQFLQINLNNKEKSFSWRQTTQKENSSVSVNNFTNDSYKEISGIIFSEKTVLNHPEKIGEDCIFINNPFANNSVDQSFSGFFKNWLAIKDDKGVHLKKNY